MSRVLLVLFIAFPVLEIYVLIKVGGALGAIPTIALVVFSAVLGAFLVHWQGMVTMQRVRESLARGELPAIDLIEGTIVLISGILLLLPGFISDLAGLACLIPAARRRLVKGWFTRRQPRPHGDSEEPPSPNQQGPRIIEGEYRKEK